MSFPTYPAYKDSGVKWLSDVPEHWHVRRNKQVFRLVSVQVGNKSADFQLLSLTLRGVIPRDMESGKGKFPAEFDTYQVVEPGDIVFCLFDIDETPRTVGISSNFGMITGAYTVAKTLPVADPRFIYYYYFSIDLRKGLRPFYTGLRKVVRPETFLNIELPLPPLSEQANICNFLDHETARIDALIEEQQRLIELLKEKRQAVISHAVTKGLDPTVPMKDSGVEWLGEVPAHWSITNIKRVGAIRYGIGEPPQYYPEGMPLIRATNVHAGKLFSEGLVFVDPTEIPARRIVWLEPGDIVVVRSGAYTGDSAIIPDNYGQCIAGFDMVLRCHSAQPSFIQFALLSKYLKEGQLDLEKMRAAQPHLNAEELGACMLVLPAMEEQIKIVEFLQTRCSEFDILTTEAERAKSLLQERRSALISAAVTGKIDVRGWQPAAHTQAPEPAVAEAV